MVACLLILVLVQDATATLRFVQMSNRLDWLNTHNELVRRTLTAEALAHLKARETTIESVCLVFWFLGF